MERHTSKRVRAEQWRRQFDGEVTFTYESMELTADPGLTMFVYTTEPGSKSEQALNLLASWIATPGETLSDAGQREQPQPSN